MNNIILFVYGLEVCIPYTAGRRINSLRLNMVYQDIETGLISTIELAVVMKLHANKRHTMFQN